MENTVWGANKKPNALCPPTAVHGPREPLAQAHNAVDYYIPYGEAVKLQWELVMMQVSSSWLMNL